MNDWGPLLLLLVIAICCFGLGISSIINAPKNRNLPLISVDMGELTLNARYTYEDAQKNRHTVRYGGKDGNNHLFKGDSPTAIFLTDDEVLICIFPYKDA